MKPRRILISVMKPAFGLMDRYSAVASVVYAFADVLRREGYEVFVNDRTLGAWERDSVDVSPRSRRRLPRVHRVVPARVRELIKDMLLFRSLRRLRRAIEAIPRPDVIINWISYGSSDAIDLGRMWDVPVVSIFDAPLSEEYEFLIGFPPLFQNLVDHHERRCVLESDSLIMYSHAVHERVRNRYGATPTPFFMAFTDFKRMGFVDTAGKAMGACKFAYVGSFFNWHRVEDLVEAFDAVNRRHPDARLYLVGDGPEFERIRRLAKNPSITLTGRLDGPALDDLLQQVHVGVIPNALWHQAPVKLFQYSAFGLAVISRDTPTIHELTQAKDCYVRFADRVGLEREMEASVEHPSLTLARGRAAQEHVRQGFSPASYAAFFEAVFASLRTP